MILGFEKKYLNKNVKNDPVGGVCVIKDINPI